MKRTIQLYVLVLATVITLMLSTQGNLVIVLIPEGDVVPFSHGSLTRIHLVSQETGEELGINAENMLSDKDQTGRLENDFFSMSAVYETNMATGTIYAGAFSTLNSPLKSQVVETEVALFDTVSFNFDGMHEANVGFSLSVDGFLSNADSTDAFASSTTGVVIADVTSLGADFYMYGSHGVNSVFDLYGSPFGFLQEWMSYQLISPVKEEGFANNGLLYEVNTSGNSIHIEQIVTGEFTAIEGNIYLFMVVNDAIASGDATTVDLTSTFAFTDLSGGSFVSASGVLPGSSGTLTLPVSISNVSCSSQAFCDS